MECRSCDEQVSSLYSQDICLYCFRSYLKDKIEDFCTDLCHFETSSPEYVDMMSDWLEPLMHENALVFPKNGRTQPSDPMKLWTMLCEFLPQHARFLYPQVESINDEDEEYEEESSSSSLSDDEDQDDRVRKIQLRTLRLAKIARK